MTNILEESTKIDFEGSPKLLRWARRAERISLEGASNLAIPHNIGPPGTLLRVIEDGGTKANMKEVRRCPVCIDALLQPSIHPKCLFAGIWKHWAGRVRKDGCGDERCVENY